MSDPRNVATRDKIAVIGIGCRLPGGASDHRTFWQNLLDGKDCITATPRDRYDVTTLGSRDRTKPGRLVGGRGGYIDGFDEFDPAFFGISPREAAHMDPQQRKVLEVAWEALEDGGQKPAELAGSDVGVFVGAFTLDYKILQFSDLAFETLAAHTATGTMMTMVSNRVSYCFDFRGPSVSLDTACSSSLVAVHLACESLSRGETSLALAGGTLLHMAPQYTIAETKGGFLSPDGRSRAFDASADGYVRAEGVGLVALKRLDDALRDGDPVHAVIIGSGVNQDGRTAGITVPSADAQVSLIERVCADAGIVPGSLQYVEAHGTSTPVGDPIEAGALGRALSIGRKPGAACYVGSVKTNIGHTESAAGIAGLIKTVLCLKHRTIPPHINLGRVNPAIDLDALPYEIPTRTVAWPEHDGPARAGVNSFGFGGTNAHVLLEAAPPRTGPEAGETAAAGSAVARDVLSGVSAYSVLPLTTRDPELLPEAAARLRQQLSGSVPGPAASLTDIAYTLARRRQHLESRLSVVYDSRASLEEALDAYLRGEAHPRVVAGRRLEDRQRRLVWVFTGMGPQWWGMGRQLFETEPVYRAAVERCDREIRELAGWSLVEELCADEADSRMGETWLAQPANFALQVGLAALWRSRGVRPDAVVGHSTGEVAAFYEAGVYTLREAVTVVVHRSRLQQKLVDTGGMLAVSLSEDEAQRRVVPYADRVAVAAVNSPTAITLAGDTEALAELAERFRAEEIFARPLAVRVPYHSPRMDPIKDELLFSLAGLKPRAAQVPLYLTGGREAAARGRAHGTELDAGYWWNNVRDSVRFGDAVNRLADDGYRLFLEIGPHPALGRSITECLTDRGIEGVESQGLPSIRRQEDEQARFLLSLAALHNAGVEIAWEVLHPHGTPVTLPRYPWRRDRHWTEPKSVEQIRLGRRDHPLLGRRLATGEPIWEARLDVEALPYLRDHRIQGSALFPAAGYVEMAAQAVRAMTGGEAVFADIELRKALFLSLGSHDDDDDTAEAAGGGTATVQLSFSSGDAAFTVATVNADDTREPAVHARGVVRSGQHAHGTLRLDADQVRARTPRRLDRADCYAALAALGYHYGPAFQGIEEVWIGPDEALARIRPTEPIGGDAAHHHMHPVLLDACFQTLLTPQLLGEEGSAGGIRLPLSIDEVRMAAVGDRPLWAHATVTRQSEGEVIGDIAVYGDDGASLGRISGFRAADVEKAPAAVSLSTVDSWLADISWTETPPAGTDAPGTTAVPRWLVFADSQGVAEELAALITDRGGQCHLVRPGTAYRTDHGPGESTVRPDSAADLDRLFADLRTGDEACPYDHVVHLWNLDLPALDATDTAAGLSELSTAGAYSLIALARTLPHALPGGRLHIVTRGVQAVVSGDPAEPLAAPAWGVGRVLWQQELTAHRGKLIDLDPAAGHDSAEGRSAEARALLREVTAVDGDEEDEIALRGGRRYTSRLLPAAGLTRPLPLRLRADGAYLVTGAFGALGRLLCRALVGWGARRLILVGRTRLPDRDRWRETAPDSAEGRAIGFVRELEALGAQPTLAPLDICDEASLTGWLSEYRRLDSPPIRGVFHLAGQVRDTLLPEMDPETFRSVHHPKVLGAYLLHRHLGDEPLDHFVLFSSIASLLTTAGQTNYAAGNAFLDALAHHRRARGLPGLSLDWGPWATGMIEELGLIEHYRAARGMSSLSPEAGMAVLARVIGQDRAQLLVATVVDWPVFLAWYASPPRLVRELAAARGGPNTSPAEQSGFLDSFRAADDATRLALTTERFLAVVAGVLSVGPEQVALDSALGALGLDSLLAMELRSRIHTELGVALPVVTLLSGAPVADLVSRLYEGLAAEPVPAGGGEPGGAAVELFHDEGRHPLTQNQKALWFLKQLNPDGFAYNIGGAVEVRARLDPQLMFDAFCLLIERHPSLRANFVHEGGQPVQKVAPAADAALRQDVALFDVQGVEWDAIHAMIVGEYRKPYDLERDPLVRLRLFRRAPDRWVLMKAVHHIISDAISTFTFIEELLAVHDALRRGRTPQLPPVSARYLDFLNWQNGFLAGPDARRMVGYWKSHLPADIPVLDLPTDRPRPAVQTHNGASEFFVLDTGLSARVHEVAREHNVTVFMVLLSAYYVLLHRYSGQDDIIVGSPVTGRTQEEFSSVYGYFVNPLPLHVPLGDGPSVEQLLARVRDAVLGGLDNQEYPFVLLVEELDLQHDPSRSAVFQAMFILLTHKVATEKYGHRLEYIELPEEEGQFDVTLSVYEDEADQRFHCVFKYNTDLFLPETMRRFSAHYVSLLDALTRARATTPADRLELLGAGERQRILGDWSGAGRRTAAPVTPVHELIGAVAAAHPEAIAVRAPTEDGGTGSMTYAELARRSGDRARALRARGVVGGALVAVCMEKSPELIVTLLAVLRAGGAYLPLDPGNPAERLAAMVAHAGAAHIVVDDDTGRERFAAHPGVLTPAELSAAEAADPSETEGPEAEATVDLDGPAYAIFTSGSTGRPKAVLVSHRNVASAYAAWRAEYRLDTDARVHLQLANPSFDVFTGDLVRALCSGGTLVLIGRELLFDTARLYATMRAERVDCAEFVPSVVRGLMAHCERAGTRLDFMRLLVVGSDTWKVEEYDRLRGLCGPDTRLVNSYGLTEATIDSTYFEGPTDGLEPSRMVPIGRAFPGTEVYILDRHGEPVPPGVSGELWIGGAGVATGYLHEPERTAERFVDHTFGPGGAAAPVRLYRTGDLARWDADGGIHLLGRADSQVKVSGHRVEVGEIEAQLALWPALSQAVVAVRPDDRGDNTLCAYGVAAPGATLEWRELRRHLGERLPTYLIPASFTELPELPVTPNGKVDVVALPRPRSGGDGEAYEPPVTLYEERMAHHWTALLGVANVGLQHDFFEIGGSSIKLIELIHGLQSEFSITIPVSQLFKATMLHGMARTVEDIITGRLPGAQPYLRFNRGAGEPVFCFPPAGGHGLVYRRFAEQLPDHELVAFNYLTGDDKVARYADLVAALRPEGVRALLGYSLGGNLAFEVAKELERRGREVGEVVIIDSYRNQAPYTLSAEDLTAFERELREHLRKHTGSETLARETLAQATDYIGFCGRTPNLGTVDARVTVISDEEKAAFYAAGETGSWHGASNGRTEVLRGSGVHADMFDPGRIEHNAALVRGVLTAGSVIEEATHAA
ncbi:non-ribosomal peptide synthetase/type I polyketide synthase [Streptomyces paludis]|uniref:Amino acid adenylation domain-containing protein n=1 Tax=Streptomyces paludis TaxID=2282738 RepID=A0A345HQP4_9ACTN|nr:non-ribosomal peptide synthetase/type I polyketide synthase [Streptomyces paludis]AXG79018.1 amino acid adenylation domain-containing protein [Streptomyces paludis]